jgi:hypothetical protein
MRLETANSECKTIFVSLVAYLYKMQIEITYIAVERFNALMMEAAKTSNVVKLLPHYTHGATTKKSAIFTLAVVTTLNPI